MNNLEFWDGRNNYIMMESMLTLSYENQKGKSFELRSFMDVNGDSWWAATDVCEVLEIRNPRQAVTRLKENEKQAVNRNTLDPVISNDRVESGVALTFVNEPGLYRLIFSSRKKESERFKDWVFTEVLPSIRKTGRYDFAEAQMEKLTKHGNRDKQIDMSKEAAIYYLPKYGRQGITKYHSWTCKGFTGKKPEELKLEAKALKLPSVMRSSGRECIRAFWPETAACVSFQDELVVKDGYDPKDAHDAARLLEPFFEHRKKLGKLDSNEQLLFDITEHMQKPSKPDILSLPNPFPYSESKVLID